MAWWPYGHKWPNMAIYGHIRDFCIFCMVSEPVSKKIGTEKILEPVSKNFGTEKKSQNRSRKKLLPKKISEPVPKFFRIFLLIWIPVSSCSRDFCIFLFGIGIGLEKNDYRKKSRNRFQKILVPKKVLELVSKKFGTEKKSQNRYRSDLGLVTHWHQNGHINSYSDSNLRRAIWIMYHHVI